MPSVVKLKSRKSVPVTIFQQCGHRFFVCTIQQGYVLLCTFCFGVFGCCQTRCPSLYVYCAVVVFLYFCLDYFTLFVCKGAHRVTDLAKCPVRISEDEAPTLLPVVGPLFIPPLLFHLSRALLGAWRFGLFRCLL